MDHPVYGSKTPTGAGCSVVSDNFRKMFKMLQKDVQATEKVIICSAFQSALDDCLFHFRNRGCLIHFCWVPGHMGIRGNELADTTAKNAVTQGG
jgi:ribonuclease HI